MAPKKILKSPCMIWFMFLVLMVVNLNIYYSDLISILLNFTIYSISSFILLKMMDEKCSKFLNFIFLYLSIYRIIFFLSVLMFYIAGLEGGVFLDSLEMMQMNYYLSGNLYEYIDILLIYALLSIFKYTNIFKVKYSDGYVMINLEIMAIIYAIISYLFELDVVVLQMMYIFYFSICLIFIGCVIFNRINIPRCKKLIPLYCLQLSIILCVLMSDIIASKPPPNINPVDELGFDVYVTNEWVFVLAALHLGLASFLFWKLKLSKLEAQSAIHS